MFYLKYTLSFLLLSVASALYLPMARAQTDDALGASIVGTPDSSFNNMAEQNLVSARQQIRISNLFAPYINSAGTEVTPSTADTRVLLALDLDFSTSNTRPLPGNNIVLMRLRDGDDSNNAADTRSSIVPLSRGGDDVFVLLGGNHTGPIPNFTSGQCAGEDIANVYNPIRVGSSADRTQDGGASFTLDIFVEDEFSGPNFYGVHSVDYRAFALCSNHELFDVNARNVMLTGHVCQGRSFPGRFRIEAIQLIRHACRLATSPEIGVVETARPDIVLSFVNTGMPETASVADILADPGATIHDFGSNLVFNTLEPDAARPAINRAAIPANGMVLIARLSDNIVNISGSAIVLNHLSEQLDRLLSQFTFVPSPDFMARDGIPNRANGVVIGTLLPLEDELMEGTIDYPLLMAGATDYIVATRESAIRAAIHTRLPMVENPITGMQEQQAADHIFRLALDLDNTLVEDQVQNQILPTIRVVDADDYFHYLLEGPEAALVSNAVRNTIRAADAPPVVNLNIGLGGAQIAWSGNDPTNILSDAIMREMMAQVLSDAQFDRAEFLDPSTPTFTASSLFVNADSTAELEGAFQDVRLEIPSEAVNIVLEGDANVAAYRSAQPWWQLRFVSSFIDDAHLEIALAMRETNPTNPAAPRALRRLGSATHLRYEVMDDVDDDALGVSIVGTPNINFNNLAEQNLVSARQQIRISNLFAPYINSARTEVTPSTTDTRVLLALDLNFRASANTPLATHNTFFMRLRDGDDSNNAADTRRSNQPLHGQLDDVFVLLGGNHTGPIPNFTSGQCAGEDIANVYNPIRVGSSADRTQDGGASFTLDIFAEDASSNPDFHGIHFVAQRVLAVCSNHELFDATASNVALRGHVCQGTSFRSTFRTGARPLRFQTCVLANSPEIGVVETARPDIVLSFVNTGMPETASVADILADPSATIHDFGSNLVFNTLEPDAARPAINRAAIPANGMALIARLSDDIVNNSGSAIVLNHLSDQLDQFASQFTFVPSPDFMATDGIPHGANGVVIGTILPLEDELMEGTIDYPLLMAGATDYIVATRESAIRAAIHTRLPMVDNPLTGVPEQQAADHIFRLALDLSGTPAQTQVQNQILPTIRVIDADDYFHYLLEGPEAALVSNAVRNTITEANTPPVVNLNIGLGGARIAWGGNNPTRILSDAITHSATIQTLTDAQFDRAEFLDPATPTFTTSSLFVNALSTAELEGEFQDVRLEISSEAVNIMLEGDANVAAYRSAQPWWQLRFVTDFIGDKHLEIALAMRETNPTNFGTPRTLRRLGSATHLRYEVVGNLGVSIGGTPDSSFNNLAEQNLVSARQQIRIGNLFAPYINSAGDEVTPSTADTRVLLAFDLRFSPGGFGSASVDNTFLMRLRDGDDSNNAADTRSSGLLIGNNDDVFVLLGGDHTGPIPNFTSGQCAGVDIADVFNPMRVGSSADRTQDGGASFTLEIFAEDARSNPNFHGVHFVEYQAFVLCSEHELFDVSARNVALTGHACRGISFPGRFRAEATPLSFDTCILANSPDIGVVETARPDIVLSIVNTTMDETASVADILASASAIHDFGNNLVFNTLEPDAARPAINRAAIATNQMTLIARLSDDIVNRSGSAIVLNHLSEQLDQLPSQFTFVPSPDFMARDGIPHRANGVVIGTILPVEDELMEGTTDYPLLVADATDYIVARRASAPRAAIHTRLPMVDNPLTGVPEQQAADHIFRLALDLDNTLAEDQVQNQILPTIRIVDADDYFHYLVEGATELVSNAVRNTIIETDVPVVNLRIGLGGAQIAWGGNNPTNILSDAIMREMMAQVLSDAQFDMAEFLDPAMPTFTASSLFVNADSTADHQGASRDVTIEFPSSAVNIGSEPNTALASYRTDQAWWQLGFAADMLDESNEYIEIALAMREINPTNPAAPRALRRLGPATHLRYEVMDEAPPPPISVGLVPGIPPDIRPLPEGRPEPTDMFIEERLGLPLEYTVDEDDTDIPSLQYSAYVFNADGTTLSTNQTGMNFNVVMELCLLVNGQQVDYDPSHPYYDDMIPVFRSFPGFARQTAFNFGTSCVDGDFQRPGDTLGHSLAIFNGFSAVEGGGAGPNPPGRRYEAGIRFIFDTSPARDAKITRTVDLIGDLSIRIRIKRIAYLLSRDENGREVFFSSAETVGTDKIGILESRREIIINLNDTTQLPPLGFDFVSVSDGADGRYLISSTRDLREEQLDYPDILAGLNNTAMHTAEHAVPEGAIIQFRPNFEGSDTYYVVGRPDQAIEIPLQFEAGANPARFGGAFVALKGSANREVGLDAQTRDNRCRLLNPRSFQTTDINDTVDYCLQQRGIASENLRLTSANPAEPAIINTTGTSTVLLPADGDGIVQLALRIAPISSRTSVTLINGIHDNNPFQHLLMGLVIAAPNMPADTQNSNNTVSSVVPDNEANTDLTLEPDEHFSMRWSTTNPDIRLSDASRRNFVIRGHSPQRPLFYSERFARIQEFGLSASDIYTSDYLEDGLRYFPYFEFIDAFQHGSEISAVARESESVANAFTLRLVADAPNIALFGNQIGTNDDRLTNQPLYYTDTISREFEFTFELATRADGETISSSPTESVRARATLPAAASPTELLLHFQLTSEEDLNAINERFSLRLSSLVEVTPSLSNTTSEAERTLTSTSTLSISLLVEDDDLPPQIGLSYRLFNLDDNPQLNTGGALTQGHLNDYRVQGAAAIVPVRRLNNPDLLGDGVFPDSLSRYRFGIDVPEHDLSLPAPNGLGTIVGRGTYLSGVNSSAVTSLAPHFELYAVFIEPNANVFDYAIDQFGANLTSQNPSNDNIHRFAGLVHPHNLGAGASDISDLVGIGTREALDNTAAGRAIPLIRAMLPQDAQHIMLFARLSHNPANLDMASVLAEISEDCQAVLSGRALVAPFGSIDDISRSNFVSTDASSGNFLVSVNDHRHATGSADKLEQPFSILNILGSHSTDDEALYQYGYRENIGTMKVALLCASDPSLSPDLNDNLNADDTMGPEYCATRMQGTGARSYCQVGEFELNYTDYLPELYNPDLILSGAEFDRYIARSHSGPLYEADMPTGITLGFEADGPADPETEPHDCQIDTSNPSAVPAPAQRCNQLTWHIEGHDRYNVGFYGNHSRNEPLTYRARVNTFAERTRLQWAISVLTTPTASDLSVSQLVRASTVYDRQTAHDNPGRGSADIPEGLADSLTLLTALVPVFSNDGASPGLKFNMRITDNQRYRYCALLSRSADAVQDCVGANAAQQLRLEPAVLARVYDATNNPVFVRHPIATRGVSTATITIADPDLYAVLETSAGDGTVDEASPGEDGRFVDYSVRFGGTSNQMTDRVDLALIFYADTGTTLQLHAETSNTTAIEFFTDVDNPLKADSDIVVQARGEILPYGGLWSDADLGAGTQNGNPLTLLTFANAAGAILPNGGGIVLNDPDVSITDNLYVNHKVLLALRFPAIAPSTEPQLLARVYANSDEAGMTDGARSLSVALGVLSASAAPAGALGDTLEYLQVPDPDGGSDVPVRTADLVSSFRANYIDNYNHLQGLSMPVTQQLVLLDGDAVGISVVSTPNSSFNILAEQNTVSAQHQIQLTSLFAPYVNTAGTRVTPTAANTRALLRLDFSVPAGARLSANNRFSVRVVDSDPSNDEIVFDRQNVGSIDTITQNGFVANPVYVLLGGDHTGSIPDFTSGNCAGIDIRNTFLPLRVGSTTDRTQDDGASFTLEIFAIDNAPDADFYGDQSLVYTPNVVCSDNELFDPSADNRALTGHVCEQGTFMTTARGRIDATTIDVCALIDSPMIGVVETARPDILLSLVTTEMDESASVMDILASASAIHDFVSELVLSAPEPDGARPAINRAAIPANGMALIARLSDDVVNRSGSSIMLNRLSGQLDQFASQLTFTQSPQFSSEGGIPNGANGVVIGTIMPLEDELMEGAIDYPLLMAGATDYIVARKTSSIRAEINAQLPMVDNPITGTPEAQAADYEFRLALDLSGTPAQTQVQNQMLPTLRVVDADDYFHYRTGNRQTELVSNAARRTLAEADTDALYEIVVGLGGTQIAWGGNNPTTVLTDVITHSATIQTLTDEQFDRAEFLDPATPTFTANSLFVNADSTVELEGEFQDVMLEHQNAVTIAGTINNDNSAHGTSNELWILRAVPDFFAEGDEYLEIALAFREASPANPAMPRMLRRLGPATHLRIEIIDAAMGDTELVMEARATAVAARRADYRLPIISEYLASDVVSASNNTAHDTVSVLTLPGVPQPPGGIVAQIDVYGHLGSRDGDLVLAGRAPVADAEIPESNLGYGVNVASVPVRRFYVQVGITGSPIPTCVAGSEISADQVIAQPHVTSAHGRFEIPISLGARRPDNAHSSTRYGGTRVLRLHASILCSDDPNYITGAPASHQWQDPDVLNTTNTDTRGIPVLLRDRADEHTLSYFVAATDSLPQAGFTPSTQLGLHEEDVVRPLPNTFAQLHIHAALTPTSAEFGDAPIVPISELGGPIPISDLRAISTGICVGSEDCIPMADTDTTDYYLGSIRAGIDANNTWEPNSQLQLIGANTAHETVGTDFASAWLSPNPAIVSDPLTDPDVMTARNALLVPSMPSALFNNRVFNAPALIVSSIPAQNIMLQDAQSFISISTTTPGFTVIDGIQGIEDRGVEFQIHFGGMPTQPVEAITGLPNLFTRLQLGFVFGFSGLGAVDTSRPDFRVSNTAGAEFRLESGSDARQGNDITLTESLGFNAGDTNTTSTLTLSGANTYYFEVTLAVGLNDRALTTEQQQRVLLRVFVDDDAGNTNRRIGTVQAHLVEPEANFYIYPEADPIAPSAVNFMLDESDTPLIPCATNDPFVSKFNDFTQPYPRNCLSAQSTSAYAFSVETGGLDFLYAEEDEVNPGVSPSSLWRGRLIRVHYYSPDEGTACEMPPISGPLPADSPYVSGRYAGHNIFLTSNDLAGTREGNIVYVEELPIGQLSLEVDTRATGAAGAPYCAVLEVNLAGVNAYTTPQRVDLPSYSTDDDNNNGLPDDLEIAGGAADASQALLYGRDYCRRVGSSYNSELGALNDCDNDGVPDLVELQYGPPEDNNDYTLSRVMCIAQGYYTRFPRANLGNLLCTNSVGNQLAASQTIAAIEADWLLAIRGKDYAGVALEVDSAGPPTTFRADNGLLPSNSYWFANPDQRQVVEVYLAPTMRFRAPTSVLSAPRAHQFIVIEGNAAFATGSHYPMSAQLLGTVPESVGADIALELETYASDGAPVDPPLNTQIRFEPNSSFTRTLGTYRDHTLGYANDADDVIVNLLRFTSGDTQSSATATIDYTVYFVRPNHPLHGATLRDQRRAGEYYEIDLTEIDGITSANVINPLPETLQLLNAPTTASITTALGANPTASTLDFVLREHQILTQNAGVLYLGPHPDISTPTGLVDPETQASRIQFALRARVDLSANYIIERDRTLSFPFTNTSETWSLLPLGDDNAQEIVLHTDIRTTGANPYTLPDVATLCNLLPTCQSETGGVDYARLLFRQRDLDTTDSVRIVYIAQLWLQLGGDPAQLFDDTDEDGVPEMDGDIEGALSLPFSASGRHGHIVVEQQQVALQLGYRARTQYQTDPAFAHGANIGSGDTLDLDFHLSCVDHAGQPGDLLFEADRFVVPPNSLIGHDLLRDISGGLINSISTPVTPRNDFYYPGCLGYDVPVLIQMPESMVVATNINIPNTVAGFGVKSYSFSGGLPDGSCPQANAQSIWWQPDGMAPRFETERCIRLVLEGEPAMAGLPLMSGDSEPLRVGFINLGGTGGGGPGGGGTGGGTGSGVRVGAGQDGGSGGGAFGITQLLLLGLLALNALRARRRYSLHRASRASA